MLKYSMLAPDQLNTIDRLYEHDETLLVADMGAGKTVCTLTAASELIAEGVVKRVLVVAPVKVCKSVWPQEPAKWGHLAHLEVANASGSDAKKRIAALESGAPIVCINFENLPWLFRVYKKANKLFDGLIVDELSKLKSGGGAQFKALRPRLKDFKWRVGMTGTPVSEDWMGLYAQMMVVDGGQRLGTRKDVFQRKYFYATDYNEYNWELLDDSPALLAALIKDVVYTMPDYRHQLPRLTMTPLVVDMPDDLRTTYDQLCRTMAVETAGGEVAAESAAILSNKLLQCANGFLYGPADPVTGKKDTHRLSEYKLDAIKEQVDYWLSAGQQVCICYWFGADLEVLTDFYGKSCMVSEQVVDKWNAGAQDVMLLHPRSAGHGLNLAAGGHKMIWIGPTWSRDLTLQTIARLWRRGQKNEVEVVTVEASDSIDQLVINRVEDKGTYEVLFKQHLGG